MTLEDFIKRARPGMIVPVYRKYNADFITPVAAYLKLRSKGALSFLLESALKGEQVGRYSFLGQNPYRVLISENDSTIIKYAASNSITDRNFFDVLKEELGKHQSMAEESLPSFTCGAVGYVGYDMIRTIENLPLPKTDTVGCEDAIMAFYDTLVAFDHLKNELIIIANTRISENADYARLFSDALNRITIIYEKLNQPAPPEQSFNAGLSEEQSNFERELFEKSVEDTQEHIFAGDIFQLVLSQKFNVPYNGDAFQVYRALRNINPSPYMFYLDFIDFQVIGSSPESVISAKGRELEIIPIAGTRPRGKTAAEDDHFAQSLLADPKEIAEHVMLVDLARNDMSRISEYGSVHVTDFKAIEKYSHVMHIISRVHGRLKPEFTAVDAYKAAFPAGTVTGAPKIRAMQIINELEPDKRGIYAGGIGYFDFSGNMDMAIAIRTMIAKNGKIYYQAGAGVVADSVSSHEYEETINKGKALRKAIEQASGGINGFIHR
jgi:anthranilate synthase component 1